MEQAKIVPNMGRIFLLLTLQINCGAWGVMVVVVHARSRNVIIFIWVFTGERCSVVNRNNFN